MARCWCPVLCVSSEHITPVTVLYVHRYLCVEHMACCSLLVPCALRLIWTHHTGHGPLRTPLSLCGAHGSLLVPCAPRLIWTHHTGHGPLRTPLSLCGAHGSLLVVGALCSASHLNTSHGHGPLRTPLSLCGAHGSLLVPWALRLIWTHHTGHGPLRTPLSLCGAHGSLLVPCAPRLIWTHHTGHGPLRTPLSLCGAHGSLLVPCALRLIWTHHTGHGPLRTPLSLCGAHGSLLVPCALRLIWTHHTGHGPLRTLLSLCGAHGLLLVVGALCSASHLNTSHRSRSFTDTVISVWSTWLVARCWCPVLRVSSEHITPVTVLYGHRYLCVEHMARCWCPVLCVSSEHITRSRSFTDTVISVWSTWVVVGALCSASHLNTSHGHGPLRTPLSLCGAHGLLLVPCALRLIWTHHTGHGPLRTPLSLCGAHGLLLVPCAPRLIWTHHTVTVLYGHRYLCVEHMGCCWCPVLCVSSEHITRSRSFTDTVISVWSTWVVVGALCSASHLNTSHGHGPLRTPLSLCGAHGLLLVPCALRLIWTHHTVTVLYRHRYLCVEHMACCWCPVLCVSSEHITRSRSFTDTVISDPNPNSHETSPEEWNPDSNASVYSCNCKSLWIKASAKCINVNV